MIDVRNISKSFNKVPALKNISCVFHPGEVNLVIGRSGSGKTVLLKTIVGLHHPDSGDILFNGRNFVTMTNNERQNIRREIGMLFQGGALFDWATVEENVRFPLDFFTNWTKSEKSKRVEFCLERVNLSQALKLKPSEISGGMQKRVAIARAIALNPKYLFCDEPNSGLDPQTATVIDNLILEITKEYNITTVVNTHDLNSVLAIGERIIFIYKGEMWWEGDCETILKSDNPELKEYVMASEVLKKSGMLKQ